MTTLLFVPCGNPLVQQEYMKYAETCIQPLLHSGLNSRPQCLPFRQHVFSPIKVYELNLSATDVESVKTFLFLNNPSMIADLKHHIWYKQLV